MPRVQDHRREANPRNRSGTNGSDVWDDIRNDGRLMDIKEGLNSKIGTPTSPSGAVQLLFGLTCIGVGAFFLLLVFHTFGPGTFSSDPSEGNILDAQRNKTVIQCVCSAKPSLVITQLTIIMLVILSAGSAAFFIYFYDQKAKATNFAILAVNCCQMIVKDREHVINELVAGQKVDTIHIRYLEKTLQEKERIEKEKSAASNSE